MMSKEQFNELPRPTFRWMKVNHLELDPLAAQELQPVELAVRQEGCAEVRTYGGNELPDLGDFQGASEASLAQAQKGGNVNCSVTVPAGEEASVWINYTVTEAVPRLVGQLKIQAGKAFGNFKLPICFHADKTHSDTASSASDWLRRR